MQRRLTERHYDRFPYEVAVRGSASYESPDGPVGHFLARISGGRALDVGCGPANLLPLLAKRARLVVGVDISRVALDHAEPFERSMGVRRVAGDAMSLPFRSSSFDYVLATGVLHHTPAAEQGFHEVARVLAPGGAALVTLYRRGSYYQRLYETVGRLARVAERFAVTAVVVNRCLLLPAFLAYTVAGRVLVHRHWRAPTYRQLVNYFADQILNPVVSFHTLEDIVAWSETAEVSVERALTGHAGGLIAAEIVRVEEAPT